MKTIIITVIASLLLFWCMGKIFRKKSKPQYTLERKSSGKRGGKKFLGDLLIKNINKDVLIDYTDTTDRFSDDRPVTLKQLYNNREKNIIYLTAICQSKDEIRTFRVDRISEVIDTKTGEIFDSGSDYVTHLIRNAAK